MCLCFRELIARTDSATTLKKRLTQSHVRNVTIWKNALTKWYVFLNLEGSLLGHIASNQNSNPSSKIHLLSLESNTKSFIVSQKMENIQLFGQMHCVRYFALYTKCSMFTCSFVQDCDFKIAPTRVLLLHSLAVLLPRG